MSSSEDGARGGGRRRRAGRGDFEGPSSSRRRSGDGVWPEPFIEALAFQVAVDASRSFGRLAAAAALFNLFRVCSTWRAVSRSDLLWQNLTRRIWNRRHRLHNSWRDEYIFRHRTSANFRLRRYVYTTFPYTPTDNNDNGSSLSCCRLALSDYHLAAGFSDGSVRLFHLPTRIHISTFLPHHRDRLGQFSPAVSGIILTDARIVFASLDGDIHVAVINGTAQTRRAHLGDVVNDGVLVDFTGCDQWWVGLYAGVPGALHVWDGESERLVFVGGSLTEPEAVTGWRLLTELNEFVGRVRITSHASAVACTRLRFIVLDLQNLGAVLGDEEFQNGLLVGAVDAKDDAFVIVDGRGVASVRRVDTLEEICRFSVQRGVVLGCLNGGYALMCAGGVIRVWAAENGEYLYSIRERIGETTAMVADERHVAASSSDNTIHLWDFGAQ